MKDKEWWALVGSVIAAVCIAVIMALSMGCSSEAGSTVDAGGVDCQGPGWRSCSWPYIEGDDCREVCCEYEDTFADDMGSGFHCAITGRKCRPFSGVGLDAGMDAP